MHSHRHQHLVGCHHPDHYDEYPEDNDNVRLAFGTGVQYNRPGPKPTLVTEEAGMGQTQARDTSDLDRRLAIASLIESIPSLTTEYLVELARHVDARAHPYRQRQPRRPPLRLAAEPEGQRPAGSP